MFLFESEPDKNKRKLIEGQLQNCFNVENKYEKAMIMIKSEIVNSNQKVIEQVVNRIKQTIKDQNVQPFSKYQAIRLLRDLMTTRNRALGNYVVKKILKRLTILAEHGKKSKQTKKGKNIFGKVSKGQQQYSVKFLNTLLLALQQWGRAGQWPKDVKGPQAAFHEAYKELLAVKLVQFPKEDKTNLRSSSQPVKSQQPLGKGKPGAKIESIINNSHQQSSSTLKPADKSKPKKNIISSEVKNFFTQVNDSLKTFITILQSQQIEIDLIGDFIAGIVSAIQKGDQILAKLFQDEEKNAKIIKKIQEAFEYANDLKKSYQSIKKNPNKVQSFRSDIMKKSKQLMASIVVFLQKQPQEQKVQKPVRSLTPTPKYQKPSQMKQQIISPVVPEKNRYDSTQRFNLQLNNIGDHIGKEQFRSSSSNRFGSINGPIALDKIKHNGQNQSNRQSPSAFKENKQIKPSKKSISKEQEKPFSISEIKPSTQHQIDSKKVVKDSFESPSASHDNKKDEFSSNIDFPKRQREDHGEFGEFAGFGQQMIGKNQEQQSSDFFNKIQKQPSHLPTRRQQRRPAPQKNQPNQNFFEPDIKSKIDNSSYSGFSKGKDPSQGDNSNSKSKSNLPSKSQISSVNKGGEQNFFGEFDKNISNLQKKNNNDKNIFESVNNQFEDFQDNPMSFRKHKDSEQKDTKQFFFDEPQSKVNIDVQKSQRSRKPSQNVFGDQFQSAQKSKRVQKPQVNNPYDSDISKSFKGNPFDQNDKSISEHKTPRSYLGDNDNPFQEKSDTKQATQQHFKQFIKSLSSIHSENNPYQDSQKNPYQDDIQKSIEEPMKGSVGFQIQRFDAKQFDLDDFENLGKKASSIRNSQKQSIKSGAFFDPNAQKQSGISRKSKASESNVFEKFGTSHKQRSGFDFDDFDKFGASQQGDKRPSNEGVQFRQSGTKNPSSKHQKQDFNLDQFDQPSNPFEKSKQLSKSLSQKDSFDFGNPNKEQQSRQSGFDLDAFPGFNDSKAGKKQPDKNIQNIDFFSSQNREPNVNLDYSKTEKDNVIPSQNQFGTFSISNQLEPQSQRKNFYQNEKSISSRHEKSEKDFDWGNFAEIKPVTNEEVSKNFDNIDNFDKNPSGISYSSSSIKSTGRNQMKQTFPKQAFPKNNSDINSGFQKKKKHGQSKIKQKQPSEKEVKLDDFMPIQKIGTPWNPVPNFSKKPIMYNINLQDVQKKKQQLASIRQKCKYQQQIFLSLKRKQAKNKQQYIEALNKISDIRTEKQEYELILKKLKENNDLKQAEIHNINLRYKKVQEIRNKILEKEKLLFEKMKLQTSRKQSKPKQTRATAYKWEIFNRNLQNFRNSTLSMSQAAKSYYA